MGRQKTLIPPGYNRHKPDRSRELQSEWVSENRDDAEALLKAMGSKPGVYPTKINEIMAALGYYRGIVEPSKATRMTFQILRKMSYDAQLVRTIIGTRIAQMTRYGHRSEDLNKPGYRARLRDPNGVPTSGDRKRLEEIYDFLDNGGFRRQRSDGSWGVFSADWTQRALSFSEMIGALVRDMLTLDAGALQILLGSDGLRQPAMFQAVDGALIRRVIPDINAYRDVVNVEPYQATLRDGDDTLVEYVMLKPDKLLTSQGFDAEDLVVEEYGADELAYVVRNHRTDWWSQGYGFSELESSVQMVTGISNALSFNASVFTNSNVPAGMVYGTGDFSEEWLQDFGATLIQNVGGPGKWHKLPMIFGEKDAKLDYIPMRSNQRDDMMWREYLIFAINCLCASFGVAAEEMNFQAFLTRGGVMTGEGGAERVAFAQATGLHNLVRTVFSVINRFIVSRFYADPNTGIGPYIIEPTGVDKEDEEQNHQQRIGRLQAGLSTPNEERAAQDKPPFRDPVNPDLWDKIHEAVLDARPNLQYDPVQFDEVVARNYRKRGGVLRRWTDLPVAENMQQARMQEKQEEQGEQGGMLPGAGAGDEGGEFDMAAMMQQQGAQQQPVPEPEPEQPVRKSLAKRIWDGARNFISVRLGSVYDRGASDLELDLEGIEDLSAEDE